VLILANLAKPLVASALESLRPWLAERADAVAEPDIETLTRESARTLPRADLALVLGALEFKMNGSVPAGAVKLLIPQGQRLPAGAKCIRAMALDLIAGVFAEELDGRGIDLHVHDAVRTEFDHAHHKGGGIKETAE
jgi:hypothetical protein